MSKDPAETERDAQRLWSLLADWATPPHELVQTIPRGGVALSYLGHADTTRALIEADPFWTWRPMAVDERGAPVVDRNEHGDPVGLWIELTVCGVTRPEYGSCDAGKHDAIKELVGDAIRRGAMRFGCALNLWSKSDHNPAITTEQVRGLIDAAAECGLSNDQAGQIIRDVAGVTRSSEVPKAKYENVVQAFTAARRSAAEVLKEDFDAEVI